MAIKNGILYCDKCEMEIAPDSMIVVLNDRRVLCPELYCGYGAEGIEKRDRNYIKWRGSAREFIERESNLKTKKSERRA